MKHVVSVSIGSSRRDHHVTVDLLGERVEIERRGTDGDMTAAEALIRELDGKVDAIGIGGIDLYICAGNRRYMLRDAKRLAQAARRTPVVDGTGLKNTLERRVVEYLQREAGMELAGKKVLMVAGVDRFGMAEALAAAGCDLLLGDLIFALDIPLPLRSLRTLAVLAFFVAPIISVLPFQLLYPTGEKQEKITPKHEQYYAWAEIIAGDFHFIRRYMPSRLDGKIILTNTVTLEDVEELAARGVKRLITTTPELEGRSFGTNVMEAVLVALAGGRRELTPGDYLRLLDQLHFQPRIQDLN